MIEISILDTKSANFHSVKKAVDQYNPNNEITSNIDIIEKSKGLIIPGVSTTDTVLSNIKKLGLEETINDFYNSGKPKNNWIGFELQGVKINRDAIGSKIILKTKSGIQTSWVNPASSYLTSNDKRVLFGIGNDDMILSLEIHWAGSKQDKFVNLKPGFYYKIISTQLYNHPTPLLSSHFPPLSISLLLFNKKKAVPRTNLSINGLAWFWKKRPEKGLHSSLTTG